MAGLLHSITIGGKMITKDSVTTEAVRQLSQFKYFSRPIIVGCVKAISHQHRLQLTDDEVSKFVEEIAESFKDWTNVVS